MSVLRTQWPGLAGAPPEDPLVELAERLTGALEEVEVVRLIAEEVQRRVRPSHWCLLLGDRDELRVEHVGGYASASLLRRRVSPSAGPTWRALDSFEAQIVMQPAAAELIALRSASMTTHQPEDAVAIPFGGFEVVGCLEMVDALRLGPTTDDLAVLRRALRLGGVGIRNARRHQLLTRGDSVDEITGLEGPNRFRAALQRELERSERSQQPTTVMFVDLDHFRNVNEEHGRLVGSSLLAEVGAVLQLAIRRIDLASRWCGDTFALLLPETDQHGAERVADRIRARIRSARFELTDSCVLNLTASIGIAVFMGPDGDPERRLHEAEALMRAEQSRGTLEAIAYASD